MVVTLFSLPDIALKEIFAYLTFDEVSRLRTVSRDFNDIGKEVLNKGLLRIEKFHLACLKDVKRQLPRRESERRSHPLARHVDVLMAIETRISMLSMTYSKYIDAGVSCFIPGKVLDEMFRVLRVVKSSECPPRPHEILQELRDISSMAMEHFDDKIAPQMKQKMSPGSTPAGLLLVKQAGSRRHSYIIRPSESPSRDGSQNVSQSVININGTKSSTVASHNLVKEVKSLKIKVRHQGRHIVFQRKKISENTTKIAEMSTQIAELRRLVEECSPKGNMKPSTSSNQLPSTSSNQLESKVKRAKKRLTDKSEKGKKKKQRMACDTSN